MGKNRPSERPTDFLPYGLQTAIAYHFETTPQAINNYLTGRRQIRRDVAARFAKIYPAIDASVWISASFQATHNGDMGPLRTLFVAVGRSLGFGSQRSGDLAIRIVGGPNVNLHVKKLWGGIADGVAALPATV